MGANAVDDLAGLRYRRFFSIAPVFDASPFFFNFVRPSDLPSITRAIVGPGMSGNVQAVVFLQLFTIASWRCSESQSRCPLPDCGTRDAFRSHAWRRDHLFCRDRPRIHALRKLR
jgi:hypothetical protein